MPYQPATHATLSSEGNYTIFCAGKHRIRFRTSSQLERYTAVKEWDHGYLVVDAKYRHLPEVEEEYIDLVPILRNLYFNVDKFLAPIEKVEIQYDG